MAQEGDAGACESIHRQHVHASKNRRSRGKQWAGHGVENGEKATQKESLLGVDFRALQPGTAPKGDASGPIKGLVGPQVKS